MRMLYTFGIRVYQILVHVAALFNHKAKWSIDGRKVIFNELNELDTSKPRILMHCASLGEYEMGVPLIEKLKAEFPDYQFVISFFSPSGYSIVKGKSDDLVVYLPYDLPKRQKEFVEKLNPAMVIYVKYEYWYNLIQILKERNIPQIVISANFTKDKIFFKPYGKWFLKQLKKLYYFFVLNESSKEILNSYGISQCEVSGDTRFDRVQETAEFTPDLPELDFFKGEGRLIVAGSTWPKGDDLFLKLYKNQPDLQVKLVIAPHEINQEKIQHLEKEYEAIVGKDKVVKWSDEVNPNDFQNAQILIIDTIGLLKKIYYYGDIAYVGGGFKKSGLHNILEPAVFGNAILFGPKYQNFPEAVEMIEQNDAVSISNFNEFQSQILQWLNAESELKNQGERAKNYVYSKPHSVQIIFNAILKNNWLQ